MIRTNRHGLAVDRDFVTFIETDVLPRTGIAQSTFWSGLATVLDEFSDRNRTLLARRDELQSRIDDWLVRNRHRQVTTSEHRAFLEEIGYLLPDGPEFEIETSGIDPEIATIAGPQLVVPITNARFAVNAINSRWGSLYDALYGTDALGSAPIGKDFDEEHGGRVITWVRDFLDRTFPLTCGSHATATSYVPEGDDLAITTADGVARLLDNDAYLGFIGERSTPEGIILCRNNLRLILRFDRDHRIGRTDAAGICDVQIEAAVTTIMDCEDSVAMVDAADRIVAYRNWLLAMTGDLSARVDKGEGEFVRRIRPDISATGRNGTPMKIRGRSLLLIRNAASHVYSDIVLDRNREPVCEGLLDAFCTVAIGLHDIRQTRQNSAHGSVYVVKPKMHGPDEVELCCDVFGRVEELLELPENTVKIGIMDEERRTTVNLKECIRRARSRIAFINTGFLDRTGDEIHTCMQAGPVLRKEDIKSASWLMAYEDWNVDTGLACGLSGKAQIGKGMWAMPDLMGSMLETKIQHPQAGASTAWVPSPTAATLHATHYFTVDVKSRQEDILLGGRRAALETLLEVPLATGNMWSEEEIEAELSNNLQGILGYVVRWVDQGIGCSKIPDLNNVGLMEDRATCRISSQHVANWLHHGIISRDRVDSAMQRMAVVVDEQNRNDPGYINLSDNHDGPAFVAARRLVHEGVETPNGYTEWILHEMRSRFKNASP